jgi:hypothetical protein
MITISLVQEKGGAHDVHIHETPAHPWLPLPPWLRYGHPAESVSAGLKRVEQV